MFKRKNLNKKIKQCKANIAALESKRSRSQAALISAILSHTEPSDEDVDFFNKFTAQIDAERETLRALMAELDAND